MQPMFVNVIGQRNLAEFDTALATRYGPCSIAKQQRE
jgi:hypothetical protein